MGKQRAVCVKNLDHRVSEYMLIKICEPFGTITREYLPFHTSGELRGLPRGHAFVEYKTHEGCERALSALNGKRLLGRALSVQYSTNWDSMDANKLGKGLRQRKRDRVHVSKLRRRVGSLGSSNKDGMSATDKIRAIEARLAELKAAKGRPGTGKSDENSVAHEVQSHTLGGKI